MILVTAQTGRYAVASADERNGWVVIDAQTRQAIAPRQIYRTSIDALHAAITRAAQECNGERARRSPNRPC
jgi:hypothetical protein